MPKEMLFDAEAAEKMNSGISKLALAVKSTMGPHGQNVIISRDGQVAITKDGASVAIEVDLPDPIENVAAQLVKQIAHKTAIETGDGTTTATVLAESLYKNGLKAIKEHNVREVLEGMNSAIKDVVKELVAQSIGVSTTSRLKDIATISANGDEEIGEWISQAFEEVGFDGLVTAQMSNESESSFEIVQGMQFSSGYLSPMFLTNEILEIVFERPLIFLYDGKVDAIKELMPILEYASTSKANLPVVIIASNFDASLLPPLHKMKASGLIRVALIRTPANSLPSFYSDLSVAIGGQLISAKNGHTLEILKSGESIAKHAGSCEKIVINETKTQVLGGAGSEAAIEAYVKQLQEAIDSESTSASQKLVLKERASRLEKGIAIIHVGGDSEVERRERFDRVEDALGATKAAIAEGFIPGGGLMLSNISDLLAQHYDQFDTKESVIAGKRAVLNAITAPFVTIVSNAGYNASGVWEKIRTFNDLTTGFDARTGKYVDFIANGIVDPTKVTRRALENAASVATLILNSRCLMVKYADPKAATNFNMTI